MEALLTNRPHGYPCLIPYCVVENADAFLDFLLRVFGAEVIEIQRNGAQKILYAAVRIADGVIELAEASERYPTHAIAVHAYVPDVDVVYVDALRAGAHGISPPKDMYYGERGAEVIDPFGNRWYLATWLGPVN